MVLDTSLLKTQHYKIRIKGKWNIPRKEIARSPTPRCSSYWKRSLQSANLYTYIYIYIYIYMRVIQLIFFRNFFHKCKLKLAYCKKIFNLQKYLFRGYSKWRQIKHSAPRLDRCQLSNIWLLKRPEQVLWFLAPRASRCSAPFLSMIIKIFTRKYP